MVEYSTKKCQIQHWLKSQPKAKIQDKNNVLVIKGKKMICASIKSELIF